MYPSETRKYLAADWEGKDCCLEEHGSIEEAFKCGTSQGWDPNLVTILAVDWAFGLRAVHPTVPVEWHEILRVRQEARQWEKP